MLNLFHKPFHLIGRRSEDSSLENSPLRSGSPTTSVSSSVMSSNSGSRLIHAATGDATTTNSGHAHGTSGGTDGGRQDHSISEAVSNISSPDYQEETGKPSSLYLMYL